QMIYGKGHSSKQIQHEYSGKDIAGALDTEIKIWTESSQSEIKSLKVLEKYRKEFVGNVSHELKTPIFSLQGYISTLLDGGMDDPELVHRYLERSDKNIERLIMIVNDLEDISRLESGNLVLYKSTFDMVALVREVAEDMENLIIQSGSKLEITGAERAPQTIFVVGDRGRLEQVMTNLISNAVKYGSGKIEVRFTDIFDSVLIEVTDNGQGIAPEHLPRIFERFYRVDKARSRESGGTGLGLAIVKHIIEAHGQRVSVESTIGLGTTFSFTLPLANPENI
ncbi:MAG: ATP-binding protein, partial [Mucinivorans sp.]